METQTPQPGMRIYATDKHPHREAGSLVGTVHEVFTSTLTFKHADDLRLDSFAWYHTIGGLNKYYEWRNDHV